MSVGYSSPITITMTRDLTPRDLQQVQALRATRHYPDPYDPRYRYSGLHLAFTDDELRQRHEADPGSRYIYARNDMGNLEGYLRLSVLDPNCAQPSTRLREIGALLSPELRARPVLFVAVVVVAMPIEGRFLEVQGYRTVRKLGETLYEKALVFGETSGCGVTVADVYVSPHANARSLGLHQRLGFRSLGYPLVIESLGGVEIHSVRLAKVSKSLRTLERRGDGLWHESSQVRLRDPRC